MHSSLHTFIETLRREDEIIEIVAEVDPYLEIAEIHRRVIEHQGKALLFTNVKGSQFPVVTNLFGTVKRIELAFGPKPLEFVKRVVHAAENLLPPKLGKMWEYRDLAKAASRLGTRQIRNAPVLSTRQSEVDLEKLPFLQLWHQDLEGLRQAAADELANLAPLPAANWRATQRAAVQLHNTVTVIGAQTCTLVAAYLKLILKHRDDLRPHLPNLQSLARRIDAIIGASAAIVSDTDGLMSGLRQLATNDSASDFIAPRPFHWEPPLANPPNKDTAIEYLRRIPLAPEPAKHRQMRKRGNDRVLGKLEKGDTVRFRFMVDSDNNHGDVRGALYLEGGAAPRIGHQEVTGVLTMNNRSRGLGSRLRAQVLSIGRPRQPGVPDAIARRGTIDIHYDDHTHYGTYDAAIESELQKLTGKTIYFK